MYTLAPIGRRVLVRRIQTEEKIGSIHIPDAAKEKPQEADVLALGIGRDEDGRDVTSLFTVRVGDRVIISKYGGTEVKSNGEDLLILNELDILAVAVDPNAPLRRRREEFVTSEVARRLKEESVAMCRQMAGSGEVGRAQAFQSPEEAATIRCQLVTTGDLKRASHGNPETKEAHEKAFPMTLQSLGGKDLGGANRGGDAFPQEGELCKSMPPEEEVLPAGHLKGRQIGKPLAFSAGGEPMGGYNSPESSGPLGATAHTAVFDDPQDMDASVGKQERSAGQSKGFAAAYGPGATVPAPIDLHGAPQGGGLRV